MTEQVKLIQVFYDNSLVGKLALGPDRRAVFEYDGLWLQSGFSISPFYLPLKAGLSTARSTPFDGLFGVFFDSLPDGWGKLLMDRWLQKQGVDPFSMSTLERLALVGSNGMGALTYMPDHAPTGLNVQQSLDYYAMQVEKVLCDEDTDALDELVKTAGSSAGVRPKVMVHIDSHDWLVKFRAVQDPPNIGELEYTYSLLAKKSGIDMPETRLFNGKYFGVRRFDRTGDKRLHVHSAAGLLYASHRLPSLDYTELMKATLALTRNMEEVEKMFRLMVFNVVIGNRDDHARNFSYIYIDRSWKMSPAYDLLPSAGFGGQHTTTVNGQGNPTIKDCMEVARQTGFPEKKAKEIINQVQDVC